MRTSCVDLCYIAYPYALLLASQKRLLHPAVQTLLQPFLIDGVGGIGGIGGGIGGIGGTVGGIGGIP